MKPQEVELWAREIIDAVQSHRPVEDSSVELKTIWPEPEKAASRLAAHANAARGVPILWLIGVDEKSFSLTGAEPRERESWYTSIESHFDGFAPRLLVDVNITVRDETKAEDKTIVALYFETEKEAPYVVKNPKSSGAYPEYIVPWREGTRLRAARREDLLRILVPIQRFSALADELEFNMAICEVSTSGDSNSWGCPFREEEFHRALRDGAMATLPKEVRELVHKAYITIGTANQRSGGALGSSVGGPRDVHNRNQARTSIKESLLSIQKAHSALVSFLRGWHSERP